MTRFHSIRRSTVNSLVEISPLQSTDEQHFRINRSTVRCLAAQRAIAAGRRRADSSADFSRTLDD